ncbi:MAG: hypothetical protein ACLFVJ_05840 [Persicimonas sp.]
MAAEKAWWALEDKWATTAIESTSMPGNPVDVIEFLGRFCSVDIAEFPTEHDAP